MDYEELMENLNNAFGQWCYDNNRGYTQEQLDKFLETAEQRIEEIMTGGLDTQEAYDMYLEEINDDLSFILNGESDGEKE